MRAVVASFFTIVLASANAEAKARPFPSPERRACSKETEQNFPIAKFPMIYTRIDDGSSSGRPHPARKKFFDECMCRQRSWLSRVFSSCA